MTIVYTMKCHKSSQQIDFSWRSSQALNSDIPQGIANTGLTPAHQPEEKYNLLRKSVLTNQNLRPWFIDIQPFLDSLLEPPSLAVDWKRL